MVTFDGVFARIEQAQSPRIETAEMAISGFAGIVRTGEGFVTILPARIAASEVDVKNAGRDEALRTKTFARVWPPADHVQVGKELELNAMLDQQRVKLFLARFVIEDDAESFPGVRVTEEVDAVDTTVELEARDGCAVPGAGG